MIKQIIAIVFIYVCAAIAWGILGGTVLGRTYSSDSRDSSMVSQLWGTQQNQLAPNFYYETHKEVKQTSIKDNKSVTEVVTEVEKHNIPLDQSAVTANLHLEHRQKGLLWYSTYKVHFTGDYKLTNPTDQKQTVILFFPLPAQQAIYDNLELTLNDHKITNIEPNSSNGISESIALDPKKAETVRISYDSQGLNNWVYSFGSNINQVRNFSLKMTTDFDSIDFPEGSMSPTQKQRMDHGWQLSWNYKNLLTGYNIGMKMPEKLNPGPWVSKVTFFAPVSLFMFFFLMFVFTTIKGIRVHPMNYFFLAAAFFSFHLLLAYLVDHLSVDISFLISSVVSVFLVISYMRLVVSSKFAFLEVGLSQFVYLVVFSYTFFFEQYTGLVITVMSILTLFIMMQFTGRIDWSEVFRKAGTKNSASREVLVTDTNPVPDAN